MLEGPAKSLLVMCLQNNGGPGLQGRKLCRNWDWINYVICAGQEMAIISKASVLSTISKETSLRI